MGKIVEKTGNNTDKMYSLELQSLGVKVLGNPPLFPLYLGREQCTPSHTYSRSRNHWILHYVESGTGVVYTKNREYHLGPGQVFLIAPNQEHWYQADSVNPWTYQWVGFHGPDEKTLANWLGQREIPPVFKTGRGFLEYFEKLKQVLVEQAGDNLVPLHLMLHMMSLLKALFQSPSTYGTQNLEQGSSSLSTWDRILSFLEAHFCEPITLEDLCHTGNVSRMELYRLCKAKTGQSPKEYLTNLRMDHGKWLLADPQRPVSRVASLCGYREYQSFIRQFRRWFGINPSQMREQLINSPSLNKM